MAGVGKLPYILESNPHPFYSFRGLKNQMRIRITCGLDLWSWAGFWKNDRAAVRAVWTIQYNNLLFYLLFIILYNILCNVYNLLFIRLAIITYNWIVIRHPVTIIFIFTIVLPFPCSWHPLRDFWRQLKERCGLEPWTDFFLFPFFFFKLGFIYLFIYLFILLYI